MLAHVCLDIQGGILGQRIRELTRNLIGQLLRRPARRRADEASRQPEEEQGLHDQQRCEQGNEADGDAPIQAAEELHFLKMTNDD